MSPVETTILLFIAGVGLLVAEMFLPTHGVLGALGLLAIFGGVGYCFYLDQVAGVIALGAVAILAPIAGGLAMRLWPRTPLGRRLVLNTTNPTPSVPTVAVGQTGVALSELRPMGTCQFGELRLEAISDFGLIAPNTPVRVVALNGNRPLVRPVQA